MQRLRRGKTPCFFTREATRKNSDQIIRNLRVERFRRSNIMIQPVIDHRRWCRLCVGEILRQQAVQADQRRIDVTFGFRTAAVVDLFEGHVRQGAANLATLRDAGETGRFEHLR